MEIPFKGAKWFKCDLHLHTPESKCFQDRRVTPDQWVARAIEQGLNCVAVTDHNTGACIDSIVQAARGTGLKVFPGVEITCDTSKVHLLILFDLDKTTSYVNDFLVRCNIDRETFADQSANTSLSILEVAELANNHGGIVIPAHIDEYNGLGSISPTILKSFYDLPYINAVQVVHKEFIDPNLVTNNNEAFKNSLNQYYNNPNPMIDYSTMADWHRPVKYAIEKKLAITTFSDNPHEPNNPKHGLDGIGKRYTWIKMDETPSLEGLRQAFLLPDFRVKSDFICSQLPYKTPDLWIKSISISNCCVTESTTPLVIDFNPQLTTIIGGRGSGKSSILRFVRGLFNRVADLEELKEILSDHNDFYKRMDSRTQKGVLNENTVVEIEFIRLNILHKITATNIFTTLNQTITIQKFDANESTWSVESAEAYIDFFQFEQYSQKQIYEIAQEPNTLRNRIDKAIDGMDALKSERDVNRMSYLETSASIRTMQQQIASKGRLQTEISDLDLRLGLLQQSGIASLLTEREAFLSQQQAIEEFRNGLKVREFQIDSLVQFLELPNLDYSVFSDQHNDLLSFSESVIQGYQQIQSDILLLKQRAEQLRQTYDTAIEASAWKASFDRNLATFNAQKEELEAQGINDISNFETLSEQRVRKESEVARLSSLEDELELAVALKSLHYSSYLNKTKEITRRRNSFVEGLSNDDKVKVKIIAFRNKLDFIEKIRSIIQRPNGFQSDVDKLSEICFRGNVEQTILTVREIFKKIRRDEEVDGISGYFITLVKNMTYQQMDEIELLYPEDEIDIKYKPVGSDTYKPLSTASAGQKTTAILTYLLSHGNIPLILDQPEDDLDNRLVFELIVNRLITAKQNRQIIVVTHNANIPVNGDAEYILSMDSSSKKLRVFCAGTVEQPTVKKEICDVMEGTETAFEMRSKRYKLIS